MKNIIKKEGRKRRKTREIVLHVRGLDHNQLANTLGQEKGKKVRYRRDKAEQRR
jgi:hypothetical protein